MKVTLLSTSDASGGAAIACLRLLKALRCQGKVTATLLVQTQLTKEEGVTTVATTGFEKKLAFGRFALDRLYFFFREKSKSVRFAFSPANVGIDVSRHALVADADVVHLHWINFGFLSLKSIGQLTQLNKPIVWTLHDMWAFTGGCHYSGTCMHYQTHCQSCPFLKKPSPTDLSYQVFEQKLRLYKDAPITFVTCSQWLARLAKESTLLRQFDIRAIPNPIDTTVYLPLDRSKARQSLGLPLNKKLVLFGAMNTQDRRKGFVYLIEALTLLKNTADHSERIELVVFGKANPETLDNLPFRVNYLGTVSEQTKLVDVYNAVDVFVLPSLEDNLPNTVIESLACGTPVVAFDTGGIPEMIDHGQNGYLARYQSGEDLAAGVSQTLFQEDQERLRNEARRKVMEHFTEEIVAKQYLQLYRELV